MTADHIDERRQQWQQLTPAQRLERVYGAVLRTVEHARWRRMYSQNRTNDFLFPERKRKHDYVQSF